MLQECVARIGTCFQSFLFTSPLIAAIPRAGGCYEVGMGAAYRCVSLSSLLVLHSSLVPALPQLCAGAREMLRVMWYEVITGVSLSPLSSVHVFRPRNRA